MKHILFILIFLSSCAVKPEVTQEQLAQYDYCKKKLLENKEAFIAIGGTKEKQDSLKDYLDQIEKHSLPELLQEYDIEQEQVVIFLYSICQKAELIQENSAVDERSW